MREARTILQKLIGKDRLTDEFLLEAIRQHSLLVRKSDPASFTNPLRGGPAWHQKAEEILHQLEN